MKLKTLFYSLLLSGFLGPAVSYAQQEPDEMALATDEFENNFYEALKQKGIENYDKAIQSLQKCLAKQPSNPVVFNELGKNYLAMKNYPEAEKAFLKATELDPKNRWYWAGLYDVYYATQDFNRSIPVVQKLTEWRKEYYQEDLVSLYMHTRQYDKALALINELEQTVGQSEKREVYKLQILSEDKYKKPQKEALEAAIKKNPKEESNYLQLIYLYSETNQEAKAEEVAKLLEKEIPASDWAQVSLFKFHLNNNEGEKAVASMYKILGSAKIDRKIKHRVLNEFLIYSSTTTKYDADLEKAVGYFEDEKAINVPKEVGKFFFNKRNFAKAAAYFAKGLSTKEDDIETVELLLYSYAEDLQIENLYKVAAEYLEIYPTHARLYYFAGLASNNLKQHNKAKEYLENGLDFVVDDTELESNINRQLGEAYKGLGDDKKKQAYFEKADKLIKAKSNK
ncbi:cytochrome C biosynthesis protein [Flavobacterium cyanobacteriorum]|uniref:Cytochrome C biosynthesis protein n=1 Tax=Flavobacterium cyanobacteriorum TaxID=2022802 RepID=A0A255YX83_9FLAO|nr:tetratricopeptide repeat protein [Flavobacterium cyanobacteriorum]OYQ33275.1 cytochrome C biosynthesis protein [Flavobacterium cyanobacteriorum]